MSASDAVVTNHRLRLRVERRSGGGGRLESETEIAVFDAAGRPVAPPAYGTFDAPLPRGVYSVRLRLLSASRDVPVVLDRDVDLAEPGLGARTATPVEDGAYSHEYYSGPSARVSATETCPPLGAAPHTGRFFLFVRAKEAPSGPGARVGHDLRVTDTAGTTLCRMDGAGVEWDAGAAYTAISCRAAPGRYRLVVPGRAERVLPLHVFPGAQTQVFVFDDGGPRAESLKLFVRRGPGFDPRDEDARTADLAIAALATLRPRSRSRTTSRPPVPLPLADRLLNQKFDAPMLGLLGAYLTYHLTGTVPAHVLHNLAGLLPGSPDVRALAVASHVALPGDAGPIDEPPLLRYGLELLLDAAASDDALVPEGSPLDTLAPRLLVDLAWTSWTPEAAGSWEVHLEKEIAAASDLLDSQRFDAETASEGDSLVRREKAGMAYFTPPGFRRVDTFRSWIEETVRAAGPQADAGDLARRLRLPVATIRRAMRTNRLA
jgi:hypothetical protein